MSSTRWLGFDDLVTGEAVALDLPAANIGLRILSGLIDVVIMVVLLVLAIWAGTTAAQTESQAIIISLLGSILVLVVWPTAWETATRGRSIGKFVLKLRTVRDDGGPITFRHALVRSLIGFVEVFALNGLPALFSALVSRRCKRIGDLAAGTYVVRTRNPLLLNSPEPMPPYLANWAAQADLAPLPDTLAVAIRQALGSTTMSPEVRNYLIKDLAARASQLVRPPPPLNTPPADFLVAVLAERRRRDLDRLQREAAHRARLTSRLPH